MTVKVLLIKLKIFPAAAFIFLLSFLSCSDGSTNPLDLNLFSTSDDVQLGSQLDSQIIANSQEYPILNQSAAGNYVQNIANEIANSPDINYRGVFAYQVRIIADDKTINAFATPGGFVYVYTGLLKFIDNEATLASIIGHEIAHAECRHATKRMTKIYGINLLLGLILGDNPSQLATISANLLTGLALLKNSRDDEYQSDTKSFQYLQSTMWYPGAGKYFFDKIKQNESSGILDELLSTHPLSQERIDSLNTLIQLANLPVPTEQNLFAARYKKQLLDILP
ncbi:MAG: beta-barrel assembly-enhancing protease [Bacteroidota bacterium]|nr:beta-barrel assembly-enhancing protease [Bacteroidota bacterium]